MFTICFDEEQYQLVGPGGEDGELAEYGDPAYVEVGDITHFCIMNGPETGDEYNVPQVFVLPQAPTEELEPSCDISEIEMEPTEFEFPDDDAEIPEAGEEATHG
jgi:hypothetical protein